MSWFIATTFYKPRLEYASVYWEDAPNTAY